MKDGLKITVSPNPAVQSAKISLSRAGTIKIFNLNGSLVKEFGPENARDFTWKPEGIARGVYIIKARGEGRETTKKILLQ